MIQSLRIVSFTEGVSYLLLLFIAMPLKYLYGEPLMVKIMGSVHGFLFVLFCAVLAYTYYNSTFIKKDNTVTFSLSIYGFILSLIPFGMIIFDRKLKPFVTPAEES